MLSPCTGASLESATDLASIYFTSPKMHRAIGQPSCSSRQCRADAIQTEAEGLVSKNTEMAQRAPLQGRTEEVETSVKVPGGEFLRVKVMWQSLCSPTAPYLEASKSRPSAGCGFPSLHLDMPVQRARLERSSERPHNVPKRKSEKLEELVLTLVTPHLS